MLLTIDIGNTNMVLGVFDGEAIVEHWRISTVRLRPVPRPPRVVPPRCSALPARSSARRGRPSPWIISSSSTEKPTFPFGMMNSQVPLC